MSKDFPNRSDWLVRRATPAKFPGRMIHVSKQLATIKTATGQFQTIVSPAKGSTFGIGVNKRKQKARVAEQILRAEAIAKREAGDFTVSTAKFKRSHIMVNLLANRRLSQRGGAPAPVSVAA